MAFPNEKQKIVMVTGKGGVGKSTIAAAMAQKYAHGGAKTLLVELGDQSYFQYIYGKSITYEPVEVRPRLFAALWSGESCLREYVLHLVRIRKIVDLFFENRIMKTFIKAAPALKELAVLGKITSGIREWGPPLPFDVVVVDAFASGHFMALLRAPVGMGELIEAGPMGEQSRMIQKVLSSPRLSEYKIVTLAEELPVTETIELHRGLEQITGQKASIYCNRLYKCHLAHEDLLRILNEDLSEQERSFASFLKERIEMEGEQKKVLRNHLGAFTELPQVFSVNGEEVISQIEKELR